jgi:hypothetical protein
VQDTWNICVVLVAFDVDLDHVGGESLVGKQIVAGHDLHHHRLRTEGDQIGANEVRAVVSHPITPSMLDWITAPRATAQARNTGATCLGSRLRGNDDEKGKLRGFRSPGYGIGSALPISGRHDSFKRRQHGGDEATAEAFTPSFGGYLGELIRHALVQAE